MSDQAAQNHWTLDRRVPFALVVTLGVQILVGVWQFAQLHSQVGFQDRRLAALESQRSEDARASSALQATLVELRASNGDLVRTMQRLEATIDRIAPRVPAQREQRSGIDDR